MDWQERWFLASPVSSGWCVAFSDGAGSVSCYILMDDRLPPGKWIALLQVHFSWHCQ